MISVHGLNESNQHINSQLTATFAKAIEMLENNLKYYIHLCRS
jgi:hypothetical protein